MTRVTWDNTGERLYETGVDRGVLYIPNGSGVYDNGVAWNGLTTVTESPSGADSTALYADNMKYLALVAAETFGGTLEAYTYPVEFNQFDGIAIPQTGVYVGQQARKTFGLCYRTKLGNDLLGNAYGYKLHMVWGCTAAPAEKAYATINDSPEAVTFSWEISTTPVAAGGSLLPTSLMVVDSTKVNSTKLSTLEDLLYGTAGTAPALPTPLEVQNVFGTGVTTVDLGISTNQPTYVAGTHVVTLPVVAGVTWKINGVTASTGAQPALTTGQKSDIIAVPASDSYVLAGDPHWVFNY